jgi:hypothetical protein
VTALVQGLLVHTVIMGSTRKQSRRAFFRLGGLGVLAGAVTACVAPGVGQQGPAFDTTQITEVPVRCPW